MHGRDRDKGLSEFGEVFLAREAMEPILSKPVRGALLAWLTEIFAADELKEVGVAPRKRAIFDGPPGVGKTTLAHHLSARLGLPMLAVRPETIIDCWVGSTGRNIGALFDAVSKGFAVDGSGENPSQVLLFLDEFDALGLKRKSGPQQGAEDERNNYVNTLLQRLEQHDGYVIAATNFGENIDPAIWRRFDMHLTLELPGSFEREQILKRYLLPFGLPKSALAAMAEALAGASPALMRQFCEHLKRSIVIGPRLDLDMGREAVIDRLVASVQPHPTLGKPPMWSTTADHARDRAIRELPWPLPRAVDLPAEAARAPKRLRSVGGAGNVVPLRGAP